MIIQSELASSQLTAIAETIGEWTGVYLERSTVWPTEHHPTKSLLEMAFDAIELGGHPQPCSLSVVSSEDRQVRQLIAFVCSFANVTMLSSSRIQECYTVTADRRDDIDNSLGICLDPAQSRYWPRENGSEFGKKMIPIDLEYLLLSGQRRVCCQGGCPTCLETLENCNMPFCLAVIFEAHHMPPTFEQVLEAGGNWVIITRR